LADVLSPAARAQEPTEWYGRTLGATCKVFAFLSGITLVAMALMSLASIIGRSLFASAIIGQWHGRQLGPTLYTVGTQPRHC
jgi:hypothetical protein